MFDDSGSRLDDATVTGKVLGAGVFSNGSDILTMTTRTGASGPVTDTGTGTIQDYSYGLYAPGGSTILVTATKPGFTTRQQTIVPTNNERGDYSVNRLTFGETINGVTDRVYVLSDKPEVTNCTPAKDATGVDPATTFTLTFNEPVNTADVESLFAVYVSGPGPNAIAGVSPTNTIANSYQLSAQNTMLNYTYDPNRFDGAIGSTPTFFRNSAVPLYDGDTTRSTVELAAATDDPVNTGSVNNGGGFTTGRNV
ncbi:MAG: Ig-like domain-containing protein [Candidatus Sericytochromatia bacterium]|nr:Ig-like domain-containing protein [Candidatus Sericytochromatia bacterium]